MKQVAVTDLAAYFDDEITAMPNLVTTAATTVGALDSGSITSGFGTIDTGSSTITTTGLISGGSLDIDDVLINGATIGHTDDTDLITLANGVVTVAGEVSMTTLDIGGTNVTSTAAELNILDGVTSTAAELNIMDGDTTASSTTVADADRVVLNDDGTMKQVAVTDLAAYFDDEITAMPNLVTTAATTVGALNSGSITSGFGTIDTGSSNITTTGLISGGSLDIDDVLINGTTIGHTDDTDLITLANGAVTIAGDLTVDTSTLKVDSSNNRVGIGTASPTTELHIVGDTTDDQVIIENTNAGAANAPDLTLFRNSASPADNDVLGILRFDGKNDAAETVEYAIIQAKADDVSDGTEDGILIFKNIVAGTLTETMRIDGADVAIGTNDPVSLLHVHEASTNDAEIHMTNSSSGATASDGMTIFANEGSAGILYRENNAFRIFTNGAEVSRFLADGTFLIGKTSTDFDGGVFEAGSSGTFISRSGMALGVNRNSSDGALQNFYKDGSQVGRINTKGGDIVIGTTTVAVRFNDGLDAIQPFKASTNAARNDEIDLGTSAAAFKELFAQQGAINTSDENEKQQTASLTDAEITAATAISKLFKTYKWNKAVASKGDNARIHSGMIAQHVQQAMTDAGLDASKYGFFCSDTWWEKEIEVPAVEAVEARGAVIDDDKNIVAEAVDAVEAQDAYTYVEQYYSAEDAPEGATQRTRLALRYNELLSFIGAATEQRLTSIEARLTALEG